jgi:hypothetical protein
VFDFDLTLIVGICQKQDIGCVENMGRERASLPWERGHPTRIRCAAWPVNRGFAAAHCSKPFAYRNATFMHGYATCRGAASKLVYGRAPETTAFPQCAAAEPHLAIPSRLSLHKLQRHTIHAIAQSGRLRSVIKQMS